MKSRVGLRPTRRRTKEEERVAGMYVAMFILTLVMAAVVILWNGGAFGPL